MVALSRARDVSELSETEAVALREHARRDFRFFCKAFLKIKPKDPDLLTKEEQIGALMPFVWNDVQEAIWQKMCELIRAGLPIELVILKARQFGVSTFFCAWIFWHMWRSMYAKCAIVAARKDTTLKELNETMNTFHASFPEAYRPRLRQNRKTGQRVSKEELYFADRMADCMFVVQKRDAMRGIAREIVLCTEVAAYVEPEEFFGGFTPVMVRGATRTKILESTAADGYFREQYETAKPKGLALFFPWWYMRALYSLALLRRGRQLYDAKTEERVRFTSDERQEQAALTRMALKRGLPPISDEQMYWRQKEIDDQYNGDEEFFNQEYPRDDVSAFERATRSAFKVALPLVRKTSEEVFDRYPNAVVGTLESKTYLDSGATQVVDFVPEPYAGYLDQERRAGLFVIRPPEPGYLYTMGADVAGDVEEDDAPGERAFSTACVYCCNTREQVAEWRGHIDPHDYGDELAKIGYWYNTALLCLERNNMGVTTEDRIKRYLNYPMTFRWPDFNVGVGHLTKRIMWETNARTKILMMGVLRQWLRDGLFIVRSPGLARELAAYRIKNGRYELGDEPSDRIIAAALAVQAVEQTEFAYKSVVLGANGEIPELSAEGAAKRALKKSNGEPAVVPTELPREMRKLETLHVADIWEAAHL
jgi:hypothetical protein